MNDKELLQQQESQAAAEAARAVQMLEEEEYDENYTPMEGAVEQPAAEPAGEQGPADTVSEAEDPAVSEDGTAQETPEGAQGEPVVPEGTISEGSAEGQQDEAAAPEVTEQEAEMQELMNYEGDYTNGLARALDNIGNVFKDSPIADVFHKLAEVVESKFGSTSPTDQQMSDMRDEMTNEIMSRNGGQLANEAKDAAVAATTVSSEEFVADLEQTAQKMEAGELAADGSVAEGVSAQTQQEAQNSLVSDLQAAVTDTATATPVETGEALQMFNDEAKAHIDAAYTPGSAEHQAAMDSLSTVMTGMTGTYYEAVMENEATGVKPLSVEDKAKIDGLNVEGVQVTYSEFLPGDDVSVGKSAATAKASAREHEMIAEEAKLSTEALQEQEEADVLKASDGSSYANVSEREKASNDAMQSKARQQCLTDGFIQAEKANEFSDFDHVHIAFREKAGQLRTEVADQRSLAGTGQTPELQAQTADSYMAMMHGVQAYNDAAVQAIQEKYANDPRGMARATNGLAKNMRVMVTDAFNLLKDDDGALGFLSEADKAELDQMSFTGVNVKYSEYEKGMDLKSGEMPSGEQFKERSLEEMANPDFTEEEQRMYGNITPSSDWSAPAYSESAFVTDQRQPRSHRSLEHRELGMDAPEAVAVPPRQQSAFSRTSREDRVAMASQTFETALANDQKAKDDKAASLGFSK